MAAEEQTLGNTGVLEAHKTMTGDFEEKTWRGFCKPKSLCEEKIDKKQGQGDDSVTQGACCQALQLGFGPQDPQDRRRDLSSES